LSVDTDCRRAGRGAPRRCFEFAMPSPPSPRTFSSAAPSARSPTGWRRWLWDFGPPLLLMLLIFIASTDVGSAAHSGRIIAHLLAWVGLSKQVTPEQLDLVNHYVRKLAHLMEYALLAVLLHRALAHGRPRWAPRLVLLVLGLVTLYAASDELHQRFVTSRTSSGWDVLLDTTGGAVGLGLKSGWEARWKRRSSG
jgi:VanZ family protein